MTPTQPGSPWAAGRPAAQQAGPVQPRPAVALLQPPRPAGASTAGELHFASESFQTTLLKSVSEREEVFFNVILLEEGSITTNEMSR